MQGRVLLLLGPMKIKEFKYSANFCEENIWHLCKNPELERFSKLVLIVSNASRYCPFRHQKSINGYEVVWWNYHVILLAYDGLVSFMYDFDSTLPNPSPGLEYLEETFRIHENWTPENLPRFKAIEAEKYLESFFSDRNHMKDEAGNWLSAPPKWPVIGNEGSLPLPSLLNFSESSQERIFSLDEITDWVKALSGAK